jgi:hypothetical protein
LTSDFVLKTIAPSCGVIIANLMFLAPMKQVWHAVEMSLWPAPWPVLTAADHVLLPQVLKANEERSLGNTNVLPYPAQVKCVSRNLL